MAPTKEIVPFTGILKNAEDEASCEGTATKTTMRNGNGMEVAAAFSQFAIKKVSKPLPDGTYTLIGCGDPISVCLRDGSWVAGN